ncbi:MAG: tyrosine-type recombinase/integrase [Syntrophobacterales bacterium]|jgi:integrase|nr:tyrosine-type recombinase/integrase [Syntrophobacterales bacterium]
MPQDKVKFTQTNIQSLQPSQKRQVFRDLTILGLVLFVEPSGKKTWYVDYKRPNGKRTYHKIGSAEILTVTQARDLGKEFLASVTMGHDPLEEKETRKEVEKDVLTLKQLIADYYYSWVLDNRKAGKETLDILARIFGDFMDLPVEEISLLKIEQWRAERRKQKNTKGSTLNRYVVALKALINWAVKRGIIENNPIAKLEPLPEKDSKQSVRFLTTEERERLMSALDEREDRIRQERENHNLWLQQRNLPLVPDLKDAPFADYFKPMILLCLNTGARRNAIFSLRWEDIDFEGRRMTLRADAAKPRHAKDQYIPMNKTVYNILSLWKQQCVDTSPGLFVFPSPKTNGKLDNCGTAWDNLLKKANIQNFRWHDMRHDFASQLVMNGVDLNTVRDLLGHADLKMTLRYAHLAPQVTQRAVETLDFLLGESAS